MSIARLLMQQGHDVTCFNRNVRGAVPSGARLLRGDRQDRAAFEQAIQGESFDAVIDMVCFTPADALSSIRACRNVTHVVQCSTVCTYGVAYDWLPVTEDHPLRPITPYGRDKAAADAVFMDAYTRHGFPITILKPSTTYGPIQGMLRQIAWDFSWIDRIRKSKPIVVCDQGQALHQHMHVEDAALGFAHVLGQSHCLGQTYNLVSEPPITWAAYHRTAMHILGREVELVSVSLADLQAYEVPHSQICQDIFAHHTYYSAAKLHRDVPVFRPQVSLSEGMRQVFEAMEREGRIPLADEVGWEDRLIARQTRDT
jgi:nucleoside-diphosphate-sugar epimerase